MAVPPTESSAVMILASIAVVLSVSAADPEAADILAALDMTTFRNSLRPRSADGLRRPADWGFVHPARDNGWAYLTQQVDGRPAWTLGLGVIRPEDDAVVVCFSDQARDGGAYDARSAMRVVRDAAGGYRVSEQGLDEPTCRPTPGQD